MTEEIPPIEGSMEPWPPSVQRTRKPVKCPKCGHRPVATVIYGLIKVTPEVKAALDAGEIALGGCGRMLNMPDWECSKCGQGIHRK